MRLGWSVFACACALLVAASARADSYEWHRTERLLRSLELDQAALPEGKRIAFIRIVREEVFVADEVWPTWFNWFHVTTRESVVRRELLFAEGEPFRDARIEETMRNLRGMGIFALVRIVAVATEDPNAVGVIVHTRDLWSLRAETAFTFTTFSDKFILRAAERNLFGYNKTLDADITIQPQSHALTQGYYARRVLGSDISFTERAGVITNRTSGSPEGSIWLLKLGKLFYNLRQRFAYVTNFSYQDFVSRQLRGKEVRRIESPNIGPELRDPKLAWRRRDLFANLLASYRVGETTKNTFTIGWDARRLYTRPIEETELVPELEGYFRRNILPRPRTEIGPTIGYDLWTARYVTFENLSTFGQSENVRVGPSLGLSSRLPLRALGSSSDSWVVLAAAGYTYGAFDTLVDLKVEGRSRYEGAELVDQRLDVVLRGATPILFRSFRLVARSALEARRKDRANTFVSLGAGNGLRGYLSQKIGDSGASRFLTNIELRSLPIEWQAVHVGAVLFYDVGSVYRKFSEARMYHSVGIGLRVLLPQFKRYPFSFDAAEALDRGEPFVPTISSGQVVPMTAAEDPEP